MLWIVQPAMVTFFPPSTRTAVPRVGPIVRLSSVTSSECLYPERGRIHMLFYDTRENPQQNDSDTVVLIDAWYSY